MKIVVQGAERAQEVPGIEAAELFGTLAFAPDSAALADGLPGADVLLGWNFQGEELAERWSLARDLKWIHWCGAGVDAALFPGLADSDVILTNARGLFDRAMAEYVLGYMLAETKGFRGTWDAQAERRWSYRLSRKLAGTRAAVFGVGGIGRETARLLKAAGVEVVGVGRSEREGDPDFGTIRGRDAVSDVASSIDWAIGVLPSTAETEKYFDAGFFNALKPGAYFINIGRGKAVDDTVLLDALKSGRVAGAMLDVFHTEPLPEDSPFWTAPNLFVSPHMSGDYKDYQIDMVAQFLDNLARYAGDGSLVNVVDKKLGFVSS